MVLKSSKSTSAFVLFCLSVLCAVSCSSAPQDNLKETVSPAVSQTTSQTANPENPIKPFAPKKELLLPQFFRQLFDHYQPKTQAQWQESFDAFCLENDLSKTDSDNLHKYLEIEFYHAIFTSEGVNNCARGPILNIPYFWHWVEPNPRHEILAIKEHELLKSQKPPKKFGRYGSVADIDRTPAFYLQDLVSETMKYKHPTCGEFNSFGWCSEREMAFVQFMQQYDYVGKVVTSGNHSWTCLLVDFTSNTGTTIKMDVKVDNTFNSVSWRAANNFTSEKNWLSDFGTGKLPTWYNKMAHSTAEASEIAATKVSVAAMTRINKLVEAYFN